MKMKLMQKIKFTKAFLQDQWHDDVAVSITGDGIISALETGNVISSKKLPGKTREPEKPTEVIDGYAIPGLANIHSHAFQRAMAGLAEYATSGKDSFWTWRDVMYRFAQNLTPEDLFHIARQVYLEMVLAGYTGVAEFHYLHHQPGGQKYEDPAEMSRAILRAAEDVALNLTHLPVLYQTSGFGGIPLTAEQARFGHSVEDYCRLLDRLHDGLKEAGNQQLGVAFHSLRAVVPSALDAVVQHINGLDPSAPLHIHIAEQVREVEDCLAWSGQRPVEWLLNHQALNQRWCLVHATHMTAQETADLAQSGAVAGICPTTEANLGDGLFPLKSFLDQGGNMGIGSDSHISVDPVEELRLLEYGQRLHDQGRNIVATVEQPHSGDRLYREALKGGALAMGDKSAGHQGRGIEVGARADFVVLDPASSLLVGTPDPYVLDRFIFSGNRSPVRDVMAAGNWLVKGGHHKKEEEINSAFRATMERLMKFLA